MNSTQLYQSLLPDDETALKELARKISKMQEAPRLTAPIISGWKKKPDSFAVMNPAERLLRVIQSTGSTLPTRWLSARVGRYFVRGAQDFQKLDNLKGSYVWFIASLRIQKLRQVVIDAFLENPLDKEPSIDDKEKRTISRSWSAAFAWIEGYLRANDPHTKQVLTEQPDAALLPPVAFKIMASYEVFYDVYAATERRGKSLVGRKEIATAVGTPFNRPKPTIDNWAVPRKTAQNPDACGAANPLDYLLAHCQVEKNIALAHWIAEQSGGFLVRIAPICVDGLKNANALKSWESTMVELAELDASIARALLDGKLDPSEHTILRKEWNDVVAWMQRFVAGW